MPNASEHHRVADLLDATARDAPSQLAALSAWDRPDVWRGRRAERFGRQLDDRRRQLRVTADELRDQAAELRARADRLDRPEG
jgi:hypothetical protein